MPSDSGKAGGSRPPQSMGFPPPPQSDPLPCPRCDSLNTKFCYYNNYNLSQPRHFCKSCRRYWTHGGTLRDVPVGGGSRKNSKRSRYHNINTSNSNSSVSASSSSASASANSSVFPPLNVNDNIPGPTGSFTSLLSSQGSGFLALGAGPGPGHGPTGFDEMGFALGRGLWGASYPEVGDLVGNYGAGGPPDTWQMNGTDAGGGGGGGVVDGDLLAWPDLAISMQGKTLK